ncbi:MAG TPA: TlpA disulfide reductase family protein [Thauera sp.]|nr:TlpA disulfide reductase family protein [Thauera sp.]HRA80739.1 TlpA disulfide reductase family protein [Thauera sp.]
MFALACILLAACGAPEGGPKTGTQAPRFEAHYLDGSTRRFPEDYAGQPVILDFWAEWCRYCPDSMQRIEHARRKYAATGLEVLAVNVGEDHATAAAFIDRLGVGYSAVLDPERTITAQYGVKGLPVTFFIARNGQISGRIIGAGNDKTLAVQLSRILPDRALDKSQGDAD